MSKQNLIHLRKTFRLSTSKPWRKIDASKSGWQCLTKGLIQQSIRLTPTMVWSISLYMSAFIVSALILTTEVKADSATSNAKRFNQESSDKRFAPTQKDFGELKPGQLLEREMNSGEVHKYRIALNADQYVKIVVEQLQSNVGATLFDPKGVQIASLDWWWRESNESLWASAELSGDYSLDVTAPDKPEQTRTYRIRIEKLEPLQQASDTDRSLITAHKHFAAAKKFLAQAVDAESRRRAIKELEESASQWRALGNSKAEATALREIGNIYSRLSELKKSLEYLTGALSLWRTAGQQKQEAITLNDIGVVYMRMGETAEALKYYLQALPTVSVLQSRADEATTLINIGAAYSTIGESQRALEYFSQALPIVKDLGYREGEASILVNSSLALITLGELQKALDNYRQALTILKATENRLAEASALGGMATVYRQLGELDRALDLHNQALVLRRKVGDRRGEAYTLEGMGVIYNFLGEQQKALDFHNQSLILRRAVGDRRGEAYSLLNIGTIHDFLGDSQKALDFHQQALALSRAVGDRQWEVIALSRVGDDLTRLDQPQKAIENYRKAIEVNRPIQNKSYEASILYGMARAERSRGNLTEARTQIEDAINIIESIRAQVVSHELRSTYLASYQNYYHFYISLLMRMNEVQPSSGHDIAALRVSERARARGFLELLAEARIDVRQGIAADLKEREKLLQARISWVQNQIIQIQSRPNPDQLKITALDDELKKLQTDREQLEAEIRQKHPRYAQLRYPTPLSLEGIQKSLDDKTALLEYSLDKDDSFLFAISKSDFLAVKLPSNSSLVDRVRKVKEAIADKPNRITLSNYLLNASSLYRDLVQPAARVLEGKKSLIIVPDGILHYLPFETLLQSDKGRSVQVDLSRLSYLVRDYDISYAPSATVLENLREDYSRKPSSEKMFVAFADPLYATEKREDNNTIRSALVSTFGESEPWKLQPLPDSRTEVERIGNLYPQDQIGIFLQEGASEENVKVEGRLGHYRYIHFAVHGLINDNKPQYSGLVLSLPREKSSTATNDARQAKEVAEKEKSRGQTEVSRDAPVTEDGLLQVYEVFNLKLNAELVVLSACETGLGKEVKGEGLIGLTRAFIYAGSSMVAVSLWKVRDKSTSELMLRFYRSLANGNLNKAAALRQAQMTMIRRTAFAHPYHWAGFVLIGRP
jgi:CHAT domain-containing protein/tetratricopeptide (TPR) repeat protein